MYTCFCKVFLQASKLRKTKQLVFQQLEQFLPDWNSCWADGIFGSNKKKSADRCFRRKLQLHFLGWIIVPVVFGPGSGCNLLLQHLLQVLFVPKKIGPVVVAVPCVLVALVVILVYTRNASTSNKTFRKARSWHHNLPSQHPLFCSGLVMEIPCRGF